MTQQSSGGPTRDATEILTDDNKEFMALVGSNE